MAADSSVLDLFIQTGAYLRGQASPDDAGLHSAAYLQSAPLVLRNIRSMMPEALGRELAAKRSPNWRIPRAWRW